jgi:protein phosphatase PTC2/3
MSTFAAINVHQSLVTEETYQKKHYEEALRRAFLGTDQDFLAGQFYIFCLLDFLHLSHKLL